MVWLQWCWLSQVKQSDLVITDVRALERAGWGVAVGWGGSAGLHGLLSLSFPGYQYRGTGDWWKAHMEAGWKALKNLFAVVLGGSKRGSGCDLGAEWEFQILHIWGGRRAPLQHAAYALLYLTKFLLGELSSSRRAGKLKTTPKKGDMEGEKKVQQCSPPLSRSSHHFSIERRGWPSCFPGHPGPQGTMPFPGGHLPKPSGMGTVVVGKPSTLQPALQTLAPHLLGKLKKLPWSLLIYFLLAAYLWHLNKFWAVVFEFPQVPVFLIMPPPCFFSKHFHPGLPTGFPLAKSWSPRGSHHERDSQGGSWEGESLCENPGSSLLLNARHMEGVQCSCKHPRFFFFLALKPSDPKAKPQARSAASLQSFHAIPVWHGDHREDKTTSLAHQGYLLQRPLCCSSPRGSSVLQAVRHSATGQGKARDPQRKKWKQAPLI